MSSTTSEYVAQGVLRDTNTLNAFGLLDQKQIQNKVEIEKASYFNVIKDGMRLTVTDGTMKALNVPYVKFAGKTGTAQLGTLKKYVNSWSVGFWPAEKPRYAFAIMIEKGPSDATYGATSVMRLLLDWMNVYSRQYFVDYVPPKSLDEDNNTDNSSTTDDGVVNLSTSTANNLIEIERTN